MILTRTIPILTAGALLAAQPSMAATAVAVTAVDVTAVAVTAVAGSAPIEEIHVVAEADTRRYELARTLDITPDSAVILRKAVGANVNSNGPLTGMAQYRGMSRMRIASRINGQTISPGGPNWMDPPLSYAPAAHLDSLEVHRGITSVSAGMETIGGVVDATTWQGDFAEAGTSIQGRLRAGANEVNDGSLLSGAMVVAGTGQRLKLSGMTEQADDTEFAEGSILPTEYRRDRYDIGYGARIGAHTFNFDYGHSETGDAGTPALAMDIEYIDSDLFGLGYRHDSAAWELEARVWASDIEHGMTNYHLRTPPAAGAQYRRNITTADNAGFSLSASTRGWTFGIDAHDENHDSNIDNPDNPMFFVTNFNDAERRLLGVYVERGFVLNHAWFLELGARYNRVDSDAGTVNATPAMMGMAPAVALRDNFNAGERDVSDDNVDLMAKARYAASTELAWYLGVARKSRAPSYQERYLWLPLQATAGLADGRTYTGQVDFEPEVAHEVELGLDYAGARISLAPRFFYRDVSDYIEGGASSNTAAIAFVRMTNMMNGTNMADPLEFRNVDAELYGADLDWSWQVSERVALEGVVNYVRGTTAHDNLYRIAPLNGFVALRYDRPRWGVSLESFMAADQNHVAAFNGEPESDSWATFNLNGYAYLTPAVRLSGGVENLADKDYADHLSGINRVMGNPDLGVGERLPGAGRNLFARIDVTF